MIHVWKLRVGMVPKLNRNSNGSSIWYENRIFSSSFMLWRQFTIYIQNTGKDIMDIEILRPSYIGDLPFSRDPAAITSSILDISIDLLLIFESVVRSNLRTFATLRHLDRLNSGNLIWQWC